MLPCQQKIVDNIWRCHPGRFVVAKQVGRVKVLDQSYRDCVGDRYRRPNNRAVWQPRVDLSGWPLPVGVQPPSELVPKVCRPQATQTVWVCLPEKPATMRSSRPWNSANKQHVLIKNQFDIIKSLIWAKYTLSFFYSFFYSCRGFSHSAATCFLNHN